MGRSRVLRQRPLKVREMTPVEKMRRGLERIKRKKMIRQMVIESARKHGIEVDESGDTDGGN